MSDAGRKMDVEDVLSSIRRLVSEEARSAPEAKKPEVSVSKPISKPVEPPEPAREKLVLTPAFRISEDGAAPEQPAKQVIPEQTFRMPAHEPEPVAFPADTPENSDPVAETVSQTSEQATPEEPEVADDTLSPIDLAQFAAAPPFPAETAPQFEPALEMPEPVKTAEAETAVEPSAPVEPEPAEVPSHPIHDTEFDKIDYTSEQEKYLDEETLRELVSEMVRSELQGELGDRITRNVRKLVRREIHRALASRDFD